MQSKGMIEKYALSVMQKTSGDHLHCVGFKWNKITNISVRGVRKKIQPAAGKRVSGHDFKALKRAV